MTHSHSMDCLVLIPLAQCPPWTTTLCERPPSSRRPSSPLHSRSSLLRVSCTSLGPLPPPNVNFNYIAEIDALLAERRDYVARNDDLTTNVAAFRSAYASSQDEVKKKSDEITKLLAELHALKVWRLFPLAPSPLISPPGTRETCDVSLGWRWNYILRRSHHSGPGRWPRGCQVVDRRRAPQPCLRPRSRKISTLGLPILQQAGPPRNIRQSRPFCRQTKV